MQEALTSLQYCCDPSRPVDICTAMQTYYLVAVRSQRHRQAANHAAFSVHMHPATLAAMGMLERCLAWLGTAQIHKLELGSTTAPLSLAQLQALAERLPARARGGVLRLVVAGDQLGQIFNAGVLGATSCDEGRAVVRVDQKNALVCLELQGRTCSAATSPPGAPPFPSVPQAPLYSPPMPPSTLPLAHPCLPAYAEVLAPFSRLSNLELFFFVGADLAALPRSVRSVTLLLPGTEWVLAQVQRAHSQLPLWQQPHDRLIAAQLAAVSQRRRRIELTAGDAPTPAALAELLAQGPPAAQVYVVRTAFLHPLPRPIAARLRAFLSLGPYLFLLGLIGSPPRLPTRMQAVVISATSAALVLSLALDAATSKLAAQQSVVAAEDHHLTCVVVPSGVPVPSAAAQGLGQVLRDSLSAVMELGTLHPLISVSCPGFLLGVFCRMCAPLQRYI